MEQQDHGELATATAPRAATVVIFKVTPSGKETVLNNFCQEKNCDDGSNPQAGMLFATNGISYGTTTGKGSTCSPVGPPCYGTICSLSTGFSPFIRLMTLFGKVRAKVIILGMNLTGTTAVDFNGTAAKFTVSQSGQIIATVPSDATTGFVTVTTPAAL